MTTTTRVRPAALILTPSAEDRIAALMAKAPEGAIGVKLSTPKRGCSGLAYSVDYVTEAKPFDDHLPLSIGATTENEPSIVCLKRPVWDQIRVCRTHGDRVFTARHGVVCLIHERSKGAIP